MARKNNRNAAVAAAPVSDVEVVSKPGMGIDEGVVLGTFFLLAVAIYCVWVANQQYTA